MQINNAEIFIEKYKELENVVRTTFNLNNEDSISFFLTKQYKYQNDKEEIRYCQEIRNLIQHKKKLGDAYPIQPTVETIDFITALIEKVKNKKRCNDICVRFKDIYKNELDDKVKDAMHVMKREHFTCVPIMNGKKVIGVFDENSLFEYLAQEEIIEIDSNLTFRDIEAFLSITEREMEEFVFFKSQEFVENLEIEFEKSLNRKKRISAVFLTPNGNKNEDITGLITAWDILGNSF